MIKKYFNHFHLFFCLFYIQTAISQEPGMWNITDEDGLPSMTIYDIVQDNKGFIWIGTENGICRFDGKEFQYYKSSKLNDQSILNVKVDTYGRIWLKNLAGQLFYIEDDLFIDAQDLFQQELSFVEDFLIEKNSIWLLLNKENRQEIAKFSFNQHNKNAYTTIYKTNSLSHSSLIVQNEESIYFLDNLAYNKNDSLKLIEINSNSNNIKELLTFRYENNYSLKIALFHKNELFLLNENNSNSNVSKLELGNIIPTIELKSPITVNNIDVHNDHFWIQTSKGIFVQSIAKKENLHPYILNNISTNCLMIDHEGNKWIGTTGQGIYVINAPQSQLLNTANSNLPHNEIYSLESDDYRKQLLIGHGQGLLSILDENFNTQVVSLNESGRNVAILVDHQGHYWCGNDRGLFFIDSNFEVKKILNSTTKYCLESNKNDIWYCSYNTVIKIENKKLDNFNSNNKNQNQYNRILPLKSYSLVQDFSGDIWIGSIKGIYISKKDSVFPFLENNFHVPYNVAAIVQASDSVLWVGTRGDGILGIKDNKIIHRYKESDYLASNTIKCLSVTKDDLWVGTDNGINKLNFKNREWEWLQDPEGLPTREINAIKIINDDVWVGTPKGLVNFSTNADHINNIPPPIYIDRIQFEDRDTLLLDSFDLTHHQNSIQIDFIGLGYRSKGEISYQYKLSGIEKEWINTTSRYVRYPNLQPGNYNFEVFALNEDQKTSKEPARIFFNIRPPWWKTWWFIVLNIITFGGLIFYPINIQIQKRKRAKAFSNQLNQLKIKALRSQMNPHFIFNALNSIQKFLTTNNREDAMSYLSKFGKLIRTIFEQSQKEKISLEEELDFLNLYLDLEKLRFMDSVHIQLDINPELNDISDEINIPPLLIQPIIENSFKHGFLYKEEQGILKINMFIKNDFIICTIEDNGIGRIKAAELGQKNLQDRSSSGIKTSKERLLINNSNLENEERPNGIKITDLYEKDGTVKGTLVEVSIYCKELKVL